MARNPVLRMVVITYNGEYHTLQQLNDRVYKDIPGAHVIGSGAETIPGAIVAGRIEDSIETYKESGVMKVISDTEGILASQPI